MIYNLREKSHILYSGILFAWVAWVLVFRSDLYRVVIDAQTYASELNQFLAWVLMSSSILVVVLISYFWLNGLKDIFYTGVYWMVLKKEKFSMVPADETDFDYQPRVDLIYTVCDDFDPDSLEKCLRQNYPKELLKYYILDDSKKPESKIQIDEFASKYDLEVVRRSDNKGFKAGNINNWLFNTLDLGEYFVILDSDEIIPNDFVSKSLNYFYDPRISIVQANHISTRNHTRFADLFSTGVESHWVTYQSVKERFGFLSLLGHGAILRTKDVLRVGGFPEVVAEDLALSIALAKKGHNVVFAKDIICEETYPVDYFAFKKRHAKWTMGNMEFIKKFSDLFVNPNLSWFEKLDILLFVYNLPLTILFVTFLLIHLILFPFLGYVPQYSESLLLPTVLTLIAPLLNDLIFFVGKKGVVDYFRYFLAAISLYGSLYFISFWAAFRALFGQATFLVTPKNGQAVSLWKSFWKNRNEVGFAIILLTISYIINQPWSVILIVIPSFLSIFLGLLGDQNSINGLKFGKVYNFLGLVMIFLGMTLGFNLPTTNQVAHASEVAGVMEDKSENGYESGSVDIDSKKVFIWKMCFDQTENFQEMNDCVEKK